MYQGKDRRCTGFRVPVSAPAEIRLRREPESTAFHALVTDLSSGGMRIESRHPPYVGEPLECILVAPRERILVHGEVAWRAEDRSGGHFGVQFDGVDPATLDALQRVPGRAEGDRSPASATAFSRAEDIEPGVRVRLHLDDVSSPMKARVREVSPDEVVLVSSLQFLTIGKAAELEVLDRFDLHAARIARVHIEVDPVSGVPQMLVALRLRPSSIRVTDWPEDPAAARDPRLLN